MNTNKMFECCGTWLLAALCAVVLAACGSGGVNAPPAPDPAAGTPLTVSPAVAEVLPGVPTTFSITGGLAGYTAASSNGSVLPVVATVVGSSFTVTAGAVTADTSVDITVRDRANTAATAKVTVKFVARPVVPLTISPAVADVLPGLPTAFAITGGSAPYTAFSSNNAILPIAPNVIGSTFGVTANAVSADTVIDITVRDATNASVSAKVTVKFIAGTPLTITPAVADLSPGAPTTFTITGGRPPYSAFSSNTPILPVAAAVNGSTFSVTPNAVTADTVIDITVRDASNAAVTAKVTVRFSGSPLALTPATADMYPGLRATFSISGGRSPYTAASSNSQVLPAGPSVSGSTFTVLAGDVTADTPVELTVRDALNASATSKVIVRFVGAGLAISPATADLFPDQPASFTITGGRSPYNAFSSNVTVLPVTQAVSGSVFEVTPKTVSADTAIELSARDTLGALATAKVTVKPSALNNQITFTPVAPTGTGCGVNSLCSGGDALVVVKAVQNGIVLQNRAIRFDVFYGSYQLVTPGSGLLVNTLNASTDALGEATVRITAAAGAATQVATIQTTDVSSGLSRRYNFNIIQQIAGAGILSTLPSSAVTITGPKGAPGLDGSCPVDVFVDYYIFGGTPPYSVASPIPAFASVTPSTVSVRGGKFTAQVKGCGKVSFIVNDASGRVVESAALEGLQGAKGDATTGATAASLTVTPTALTIACGGSGSVSLAGAGTFTASSSGGGAGFTISPSAGAIPNTVSFTAGAGVVNSPVAVDISNGSLSQRITVTVTGRVGASCP